VNARADDGRGNPRRQIAVADQPDARARGTDVGDELFVTLSVQHDDDQVLDEAAEASRNRLQIYVHRGVEVDGVLRARAHDQLLHVDVGGVEQTALVRRGQDCDRVGCAGCAQVRALERIDGDVDGVVALAQQHVGPLGMRPADLLADEQHRRLVAFTFADHDRAVDRHRVHDLPHRFDRDLVGFVPVALPHRVRTGNRRLFHDPEKLEREVGVHASPC
jgi:hypothetical protein